MRIFLLISNDQSIDENRNTAVNAVPAKPFKRDTENSQKVHSFE